MRKLRNVAGVLVLAAFAGCSVQQEYVAADRSFFEAITPGYVKYVDADPTLDADSKARLKRTVEVWKLMIDKWSK